MSNIDDEIKCVVVGDGAVYFSISPSVVNVDGKDITLGLWDTAGQEGYKNIRPLSYPGTHVFILCFSVVNKTSFENADTKWYPEVKHHCPTTPIILCGTKIDLKKDAKTLEQLQSRNEKPLTVQEGEELQKKIGASTYVECSALTREGVSKVFQAAIIAAIQKPPPVKKNTCLLL